MSDLQNISLFDVLSAPTVERKASSADFIEVEDVNKDDFSQEIEFHPEEIKDVEDVKEAEPYDARAEAEKLVNLINAGNTLVLTPIAGAKLKRKVGGNKGLAAMRPGYLKKKSGQTLTEKEEMQALAFEQYKDDLMLLNGELPFSEQQRQMLITAAIPMCESRKMKVNSDFAFWGVLIGVEAQKIAKILQA